MKYIQIKNDVYDISNRIKKIDRNYYIVLNTSNNKFEVINQSTLNGIVAGFEYPDFNMIGILR